MGSGSAGDNQSNSYLDVVKVEVNVVERKVEVVVIFRHNHMDVDVVVVELSAAEWEVQVVVIRHADLSNLPGSANFLQVSNTFNNGKRIYHLVLTW